MFPAVSFLAFVSHSAGGRPGTVAPTWVDDDNVDDLDGVHGKDWIASCARNDGDDGLRDSTLSCLYWMVAPIFCILRANTFRPYGTLY